MSAQRTERLLNVLICLLDTSRPLTKQDIRSKIPLYSSCENDAAFDRMFERDKDELRALGIPLRTAETAGLDEVGYFVDPAQYRLDSAVFTEAELTVLGVAARVWQDSVLAPEARSALTKVRAVQPPNTDSPVGVRLSVPGAGAAGVREVLHAIDAGRIISFDYPAGHSGVQRRTVQPWLLTFRHSKWYVTGFDVDRDAPRTFLLDRVLSKVSSKAPKKAFSVPADAADYAFSGGGHMPEQLTIRVRFAETGSAHIRAVLGAPQDGVVHDVVSCCSPAVISHLAAAHQVAQVEFPEAVASAVRDQLDRVAAAHCGPPAEPAAQAVEQAAAAFATPAPAERAPQSARSAVQLTRLLALVPFVTSHQGLDVHHVAQHFDISTKQLVADLELLFVCGTPGYYPDDLIEAEWADGQVYVDNAAHIAAPLQLTSTEISVLLSGLNMLVVPLADQSSVVTSARAKLMSISDSTNSVPVHVAGVPDVASNGPQGVIAEVVARALSDGHCVDIQYYSFSSDRVSHRVVEPSHWETRHGQWYLVGYCTQADGVRVFRRDRILSAALSAQRHSGRSIQSTTANLDAFTQDDPVAVLNIAATARWVLNEPGVSLIDGHSPDDSFQVAVKYQHKKWLLSFVVALGGQGELLFPAQLRQEIRELCTTSPTSCLG